MNDETMRKDFEAFIVAEIDPMGPLKNKRGQYIEEEARCAWLGWKAACKWMNTRAQASAPEVESERLREMAEHIAASSCPSDDSRLEIAYAIARHLKLDGWPCAYETASGEHIGVGVDVTEDGAWVSVRVGRKLMYSQLHNTFYTRSNAKAGEV